jgi:hypothetical protein
MLGSLFCLEDGGCRFLLTRIHSNISQRRVVTIDVI